MILYGYGFENQQKEEDILSDILFYAYTKYHLPRLFLITISLKGVITFLCLPPILLTNIITALSMYDD